MPLIAGVIAFDRSRLSSIGIDDAAPASLIIRRPLAACAICRRIVFVGLLAAPPRSSGIRIPRARQSTACRPAAVRLQRVGKLGARLAPRRRSRCPAPHPAVMQCCLAAQPLSARPRDPDADLRDAGLGAQHRGRARRPARPRLCRLLRGRRLFLRAARASNFGLASGSACRSPASSRRSGILLGFPVLRLRGDYLAIVTLAFGEIIRLVLINWYEFTGGPNGITGIPRPTFFGLPFTPRPRTASPTSSGSSSRRSTASSFSTT